MFSVLLLLLPAIGCMIARDPTEGKEKVASFTVHNNPYGKGKRGKRQILPENFLSDPAKVKEGKEKVASFTVHNNPYGKGKRGKRQILPESFLPGPNNPGELSAVPVENLPAAEAVLLPQAPVDQRLPIVEGFPGELSAVPVEKLPAAEAVLMPQTPVDQGLPFVEDFPVAERIQNEKVEQVAEVDVLPESDRMMSDRMRRGHGSLIWADDALVADRAGPRAERVMEGRITDNVDIESVKAMDHWEPDSYPLEAARVLGEEENVNTMGGGANVEAAAVKEEPKLRWGPEIEEKPQEEGSSVDSQGLAETELGGSEQTVQEGVKGDEQGEDNEQDVEKVDAEEKVEDEEKDEEKVEDEEKVAEEEKVADEGKIEDEGEKGQLGDIKKSLEKVDKKLFLIGSLLNKKFNEVLAKLQNGEESTSMVGTTNVQTRKIDPTPVEMAKSANKSSTEELEPKRVEVGKTAKKPTIKLNPKLGPKRVEVGK